MEEEKKVPAKETRYVIHHKRPGHNWRVDDDPVYYPSMVAAEIGCLSPEYDGLETKVVAI